MDTFLITSEQLLLFADLRAAQQTLYRSVHHESCFCPDFLLPRAFLAHATCDYSRLVIHA